MRLFSGTLIDALIATNTVRAFPFFVFFFVLKQPRIYTTAKSTQIVYGISSRYFIRHSSMFDGIGALC